jgi:hypothetical protein
MSVNTDLVNIHVRNSASTLPWREVTVYETNTRYGQTDLGRNLRPGHTSHRHFLDSRVSFGVVRGQSQDTRQVRQA